MAMLMRAVSIDGSARLAASRITALRRDPLSNASGMSTAESEYRSTKWGVVFVKLTAEVSSQGRSLSALVRVARLLSWSIGFIGANPREIAHHEKMSD